ncbi:MAG: hypothetical protein KJ626_00695 [Verrucomicrobia bacterium]|nr:hypothetical protein [Verrucomicrobiota bacterium]
MQLRAATGYKRCDTCESQEDRHYCLLHSLQIKNMDTLVCADWSVKAQAPSETIADLRSSVRRVTQMLDDIRMELLKRGWAAHILTDDMLVTTVCSALKRYDEMQTAINGMAETVQGLREANK